MHTLEEGVSRSHRTIVAPAARGKTAVRTLLWGIILIIHFARSAPALDGGSPQTQDEESDITDVAPIRPLLSRMWWNHLDEMDLGAPERLFSSEVRGMQQCSKRLKDRMVVTAGPAPHAFVRYSAYRYSATSFFVNGLVTNTTEVPIHSCSWVDFSGGVGRGVEELEMSSASSTSATGAAFYSTHKELYSPLYNTILVACRFSEPVQVTRAGGFLLLNMKADGVNSSLLVLHELPPSCAPQPKSMKADIAFCSAPLFSRVQASLLDEWFQYHWAISEGGAHFFVYMGRTVPPELDAVLQRFRGLNAMTVEDTRWVRQLGSTYFGGQAMALHDCQQRVLEDFKWVINNDYDEYIHFTSPQESLATFLNARSEYSNLSFGTVLFALELCEDPPYGNGTYAPWEVEKMVFRQKDAFCGGKRARNVNLCNGTPGRRKYAARPKSILGSATPHRIMEVDKFTSFLRIDSLANQSLVVDARHAFLAHFQHILGEHPLCTTNITSFLATNESVYQYPNTSGQSSKSWHKDTNLRKRCQLIRMSSLLH